MQPNYKNMYFSVTSCEISNSNFVTVKKAAVTSVSFQKQNVSPYLEWETKKCVVLRKHVLTRACMIKYDKNIQFPVLS